MFLSLSTWEHSANTSAASGAVTDSTTANADATGQSGQQASIEQAAARQQRGSQAKHCRKCEQYRPYGSHTVTVSNLTIVLCHLF